ncbi:CHAT domain-containing protein [Larkinella bovis]|uniref:CHAT domain-containing protein n=1 Tax=Larkinella bovis TaxID=683041 RepID=A0ABW0I798_9BACT
MGIPPQTGSLAHLRTRSAGGRITVWMALLISVIGPTVFVSAQCPPAAVIPFRYDSLMRLPNEQQATGFWQLLRLCDRCGQNRDSSYAKIWHRLGALSYFQKDFSRALHYTEKAIAINARQQPASSPSFLAKSYFNLAKIYLDLQDERRARQVFQQFVDFGSQFPERYEQVAMAYWHLANLFFKESDYQKAIRQADLGIAFAERINHTNLLAANLTEKANSLKELGDYERALSLVNQLIRLFGKTPEPSIELANAYSSRASVLLRLHRFSEARNTYDRAYLVHTQIGNPPGQAEVISNIGFLYDNFLHQADRALGQYQKALAIKTDDRYGQIRIISNIGEIFWQKQDFPTALRYFRRALDSLRIDAGQKPASLTRTIRQTPYKEYLLSVVQNLADTWLDYAKSLAKQNQKPLQEALNAYQLADQTVDIMRFEQTGLQSKLYWREKTHSLYEHAIETAYLLKDHDAGFHFFEKSRAVLLSDKLNELGARQQLPPRKARQEQVIRQAIQSLQLMLADHKPGSRAYDSTNTRLLMEQEKLDAFLTKTEQENPSYFRYKYDTSIPSLATLHQWLNRRRASLVSFFVGDRALYIFSADGTRSHLLQRAVEPYRETVQAFLPLCASHQQNRQFGRFLTLSHALYRQLIQPLNLSTESVIVSPDLHFIPVETLSRSATKPDFLIHYHAFSYGYSATVLLKEKAPSAAGTSDFLGMAPVRFNPRLRQAVLPGSDQVLSDIGNLFSQPTLLTEQAATRQAFQSKAYDYQIVQLFTHADADSLGREPLLYFADSTLHLSELNDELSYQTQMIVLSACKTGIGVNQQGEGILSLARGFASLGIPSVLTTLWSVEDQATYQLTGRFYHHLSTGLPKDIALQKAKLDGLHSASRTAQLPYRWAGLILVGNPDPLPAFRSNTPLWAGGLALLLGGFLGWWLLRRKAGQNRIYSKTRT